jgi:acetyl esterase
MAELDKGAAAVLEMIRLTGAPPVETLSPPEARIASAKSRRALNPDPPELREIREIKAEGPSGPIPMRLYRDGTDDALRSCLVYFHGGGWVLGDLDSHDVVCRRIAKASGAVVISVDYRMGPEHEFPAAVDDAIASTGWIAAHAASLGIDARRLAVGGDSAGGNLAAVVAIHARDNRGPEIAAQILIYPATDFSMTQESHRLFAEGYFLTRSLMSYFQNHYLTEADKRDWRASPLLMADLSRLPPALIITAGFDPLRDEGEAYARKLIEAGIFTAARRYPGEIHGFITMGRLIPEAAEAVQDIARALRVWLG